MTEKRANEILRTKYPEGRIFRRNSMGGTSSSRLAVVFNEHSKVYDYSASSYQQVLEKLGFHILYKHNVKFMNEEIERLSKLISDGGKENIFMPDGYYKFSDEELNNMKQQIKQYRYELENSFVE